MGREARPHSGGVAGRGVQELEHGLSAQLTLDIVPGEGCLLHERAGRLREVLPAHRRARGPRHLNGLAKRRLTELRRPFLRTIGLDVFAIFEHGVGEDLSELAALFGREL